MDSNLIVRNESECVGVLPLDEAVWQAWLANGRVQDGLIARRMKVSFVVTPVVLALLWLWFRS